MIGWNSAILGIWINDKTLIKNLFKYYVEFAEIALFGLNFILNEKRRFLDEIERYRSENCCVVLPIKPYLGLRERTTKSLCGLWRYKRKYCFSQLLNRSVENSEISHGWATQRGESESKITWSIIMWVVEKITFFVKCRQIWYVFSYVNCFC